jgi:hypothetical protein
MCLALGATINTFFIPLVISKTEMWYQVFAVTGWLVGIITIFGLWKMKKWAVVFYTIFNIASYVNTFAKNEVTK